MHLDVKKKKEEKKERKVNVCTFQLQHNTHSRMCTKRKNTKNERKMK